MHVRKLESTDGFVLIDVAGADHAVGIVRLAPKILVDGATWLARSVTYQWASFERRVSGASGGINTRADGRDAAVAAFVGEIEPLVVSGEVLLSPGKGLSAADLAPLAAVDPRGPLVPAREAALVASTVAASVDAVAPAAGGARVVIEGLDAAGVDGPALVAALASAGATVVGAATATGAVADPGGLDASAVSQALTAGADLPGPAVGSVGELLSLEADVVVVGSKAGVIDHAVAESLGARAVVPLAPVPVTAKALAVLRRAGVVVLPDFVTTAGPVFGSWADDGTTFEGAAAAASAAVREVLGEVVPHPDGPLLAAAVRAEAFLATWVDELPFGRPLA